MFAMNEMNPPCLEDSCCDKQLLCVCVMCVHSLSLSLLFTLSSLQVICVHCANWMVGWDICVACVSSGSRGSVTSRRKLLKCTYNGTLRSLGQKVNGMPLIAREKDERSARGKEIQLHLCVLEQWQWSEIYVIVLKCVFCILFF